MRAIGVVVARNPSDVSGAGSNPVWRLTNYIANYYNIISNAKLDEVNRITRLL